MVAVVAAAVAAADHIGSTSGRIVVGGVGGP